MASAKRILSTLVLSATLSVAAFSVSAYADGHGSGAHGTADKDGKKGSKVFKGKGHGGHSSKSFFERYDTDENGSVTKEEFAAAREKGYKRRDANGDGKVYVDEYVAEYEVRLDEQLKKRRESAIKQTYTRFGVMDADKDEIMTLEEFNKSGDRVFARRDKNEDGKIDAQDKVSKKDKAYYDKEKKH